MRRPLGVLLAVLLPLCALGCAPRARLGPDTIVQMAQRQASIDADPVAAKLAIWLRAQIEGAASASEIDDFLRANPDWPARGLLRLRLQQALAVEPDATVARRLCLADPPTTMAALLRCAIALPGAIIDTDAAAAWVAGIDDPAAEAEFLRLFAEAPTPAQQWQRFDRQAWSGQVAAAQRQVARLAPADRPLALARLALRHGNPDADRLAASLRGAAARDPALLLDLARWLRREDQQDAAVALWRGQARAAEQAASLPRRAAFWSERQALARDLLGQHRDAAALALAQDDLQTTAGARLDVDFLSGWILLRRLHDPAAALPLFTDLTRQSHSLITSSRGFYWMGRAYAAQADAQRARDAFSQAALRPTTFYGQAAIRQLSGGDPQALALLIAQARGPAWTQAEAIRFAGLELARAATLLVAWNDPHQAGAFLLRLDGLADSDRAKALDAAFADRLGLDDVAVAIARRAGQQGLLLPWSGWPVPYRPEGTPRLPTGLALAVMRQESSFDPGIVSPAGARGLMQLMPATARRVAGHPLGPGALFDAQTNIALGTAYLADLLRQFGGSVPEAAAAYNAGPNRVRAWVQQNGTPQGTDQTIDWIELIPYGETRNYVQRVMESQTIYKVRMAAPNAA